MSYAGIYDGGILQMQVGDISGSQTSVIQLKISENYNDYGWFCDISGSPSADPNLVDIIMDQEIIWTRAGRFSYFTSFFPSSAGINVLERVQTYQSY